MTEDTGSAPPPDAGRFMDSGDLPLRGIKVVELTHMVMGPVAGMVLADLGAQVVKIEPVAGDRTRRLKEMGIGYFPSFNRNKQSLAIDLKSEAGAAAVRQLAREADVLVENFRDGNLAAYGLDYESLSAENPGLVYVSLKGFLSGPYKTRTALDEVVQMMGGMAYINGGTDAPRRVAPSVNDILGGTFGAVGALAALQERHLTGKGKHVRSGLYETNMLLLAQFMVQYQLTGVAPKPMGAERKPAWGIYDIFETRDGRIFLAIVSDAQWRLFSARFMGAEWTADARLATSMDREAARNWLLPVVAGFVAQWTTDDLSAALDEHGLTYGPIRQPHELLDDPHLVQGGALVPTSLPDGSRISTIALPLEFDGRKAGLRTDPPPVGAQTEAILRTLGIDAAQIARLRAAGVIPA
jgi:crotonobetainyl-CoA:carnitine CoA-transferase CaiB-like acyl-CoA transferase